MKSFVFRHFYFTFQKLSTTGSVHCPERKQVQETFTNNIISIQMDSKTYELFNSYVVIFLFKKRDMKFRKHNILNL